MLLNKYASHITCMSHHITSFNYHALAIYVPETICPIKATFTNYFMHRHQTTVSVYMSHMNPMQSTV